MKKYLLDKKYIGIWLSIVIMGAFIGISKLGYNYMSGVPAYFYSSFLRIVFGIAILFIVKKLFGKTAKQVFGFKNSKLALASGIGFFIYFVFYLVTCISGFEAVGEIALDVIISKIFLEQLTTGFYEEMHYRVLLTEGFFFGKNTVGRKIMYALTSFLIFGLLHVISGWDTFRFFQTGAIGLAFAVIYLNSRNIIIPMLLHFIYDIFSNLSKYVEWDNNRLFVTLNGLFEVALGVMCAVSIVMLVVKTKKNSPKADSEELTEA